MNPLSQDHNDSRRPWVSGLEFRSQDSTEVKQKQTFIFFFTDLLVLLKEIEKNRNSGFQIQTLVTPACLSVNSWEVRQVHPFTHYTSQTKCVIQHRLDKISSLWCHKELGLHCIPSQVNGNKSSQVAGSEYWYRLPATLVLIQMCGSHNKVRFRSFFML